MTGYLEDFRIWSFSGGDFKRFHSFCEVLNNRSDFDRSFYHKFIEKRYRKFSLKTEYRDYPKKLLSAYEVYCVLWHYYFPCMFAIKSLKEGESGRYKVHREFLKPGYINDLYQQLRDNNYDF